MTAATIATVLNAATLAVVATGGLWLFRLAVKLHRRGRETRWPAVNLAVMTIAGCAGPAAELVGLSWPRWAQWATIAVIAACTAGIWWARRDRIRRALQGGDQ